MRGYLHRHWGNSMDRKPQPKPEDVTHWTCRSRRFDSREEALVYGAAHGGSAVYEHYNVNLDYPAQRIG